MHLKLSAKMSYTKLLIISVPKKLDYYKSKMKKYKLTGVFPTATPYLLAASTSTLLYPTAMLLKAFPPALLNAENSVSPQSSVN